MTPESFQGHCLYVTIKPHPASLPPFSSDCCIWGCTQCSFVCEQLLQLTRLCMSVAVPKGAAAGCWSSCPAADCLLGHPHCSSEEQHGSDATCHVLCKNQHMLSDLTCLSGLLRSHRQVVCGHRRPSPGTLSAPGSAHLLYP